MSSSSLPKPYFHKRKYIPPRPVWSCQTYGVDSEQLFSFLLMQCMCKDREQPGNMMHYSLNTANDWSCVMFWIRSQGIIWTRQKGISNIMVVFFSFEMKVKQRSVCEICRARRLQVRSSSVVCSNSWAQEQINDCSNAMASVQNAASASFRAEYVMAIRHHGRLWLKKLSQPVSLPRSRAGEEEIARKHRLLTILMRKRMHRKATVSFSLTPLQSSILYSINHDDFIGVVVRNYVPQKTVTIVNGCSDFTEEPRICCAWVEVLPDLRNENTPGLVLTAAIEALATSILSHKITSNGTNMETIWSYHSAIRSVHRTFAMDRNFDVELLASIMWLTLVEVYILEPPSCFLYIGAVYTEWPSV